MGPLSANEEEVDVDVVELLQQVMTSAAHNRLSRGKQLAEEKDSFRQLFDDFQHNLSVLQERDEEIERLEASTEKLQIAMAARYDKPHELDN